MSAIELTGKPRAKFREIHVCVVDDSGTRYTGEGLTLEYVVEVESEAYREQLGHMISRGGTAAEFARSEPDRIAWEGFRVLGIFHPMSDGSLGFERIEGGV
jgi:hypothetical protein